MVPSKLYGVLQTRAPVLFIGPSDADTANEIRALNVGETLVPGARGEEVVDALERLVKCGEREVSSVNGTKLISDFITRSEI